MKQQDARIVKVGENTFYIRPLPALRAANLSGELAALPFPSCLASRPSWRP